MDRKDLDHDRTADADVPIQAMVGGNPSCAEECSEFPEGVRSGNGENHLEEQPIWYMASCMASRMVNRGSHWQEG